MYLTFYGLEKEPFHITPDPEFLFLSPSHKEAYATVVYGVEKRKGFVVLTGEVGTGKTTILRAYLDQLDREAVECIYLFDPHLTFEELLETILRELGQEAHQRPASWMLQWLNWSLVQKYRTNRNVALIIDEAQHMPVDTLENLRMLSNLETSKDKLLQIVLVGQPELDDKLNLHALRQLKQRIVVHTTLRPLTRDESFGYIKHRLARAGGNAENLFAPGALKEIVTYAQGVPRAINIACDNALVAGFGSQQRPVSVRLVHEVIADLQGGKRPRFPKKVLAAAVALLLIAAGIFLALPSIDAWISAPRPLTVAPPATPGPPAADSKPLPPAQQALVARDMMKQMGLEASSNQPGSAPATDRNLQASVEAKDNSLKASVPEPATDRGPQSVAEANTGTMLTAPKPELPQVSPEPKKQEPPAKKQEPPAASPPAAKATQEPAPLPAQTKAHDAPEPSTEAEPVKVDVPAAASPKPEATRIVKPGDTLGTLVEAVYGSGNAILIEAVKRRNPRIKNINMIVVGDTLSFPDAATIEGLPQPKKAAGAR